MKNATRIAIERDDVSRDDVRQLVQVHRAWSLQQTPAEFSFSLEPHALVEDGIALFSARSEDGRLLGLAGLKQLDPRHGEVKTMHTAVHARGLGVGRALLKALLGEARQRGYLRVSLETGTGETFRPARQLYESVGFGPGPPFGGYANTEHNLCMTLLLALAPGQAHLPEACTPPPLATHSSPRPSPAASSPSSPGAHNPSTPAAHSPH